MTETSDDELANLSDEELAEEWERVYEVGTDEDVAAIDAEAKRRWPVQ